MPISNKSILLFFIILLIAVSCQESTNEPPQRKFEVFGTANDYRAPWLALRNAPDSDSLLLQKLTDGTQVIIIDPDSSSNWVKVQMVVSEGYVNKKWLRKIPTEAEKSRANYGDFTTVLASFREILQNKDVEKMQEFINPEIGFLILRGHGLYTVPFHYDSIIQLKKEYKDYSPIFKKYNWDCTFLKGSRPVLKENWRSKTARWNKPGCYWREAKTIHFSDSEGQAQYFGSGGYISIDTIKMIEEKISHELMSTHSYQVFHFGSDGYFWYLYGIDLTVVDFGEIEVKILN
jgi:uncharacterized protein YgiM (DUF1202 family)